uniref:Uncharacterized protein n=1 Tax=Ananas comosus var. bracteatus TaxID=296719 RepID=A0A6V7NSD4_ANACO|nr:unnamed protein product [Ananas comosus var. bracteatus]
MVMEGRLKFSDGQLARTSVFKTLAPVNSETIDPEALRKSVFDRLTTSTGEVAEMALHLKSRSFKRNARCSLKRRQVREDKRTEAPPLIKAIVEPAGLMHNKFAPLKFIKKNSPTAVLRPNTEMGHLRPVNEAGRLRSASEASPKHKETTIFQHIYEALKEVKRHRMSENIYAIRGQKQPLQVNKKITKQWRVKNTVKPVNDQEKQIKNSKILTVHAVRVVNHTEGGNEDDNLTLREIATKAALLRKRKETPETRRVTLNSSIAPSIIATALSLPESSRKMHSFIVLTSSFNSASFARAAARVLSKSSTLWRC